MAAVVSRARAWALAARPRTLAATAAPVVAASGLAAADGAFARGPALAALVGGMLVQIGTNLANDHYDFVKGGDTADRVGPVRVTQAGLLSPAAVWRGMVATLALAAVPGAYLVAVAGWPVALFGLLSIALAVGYSAGPYPLSYHGLGDVFVFVFFGLVAAVGTYYVQAGVASPGALWIGVGMGAFSTAILVVNNLRDRLTDAAAGKRTLAVRLGDRFTVRQYVACLAVAAVVPPTGALFLSWSWWSSLALLGLIPCAPALGRVFDHENRRRLNPALGWTARGAALWGAGLAVGLIAGSR